MAQRNIDPPVLLGSEDRGARGMRESVQPLATDPVTFYAVSQLRLGAHERVTAVVWGQVDPVSNRWTTGETLAPVSDVVMAIHNGDPVFALFPGAAGHAPQRRFVAVAHDDGEESIVLDKATGSAFDLGAMDRIAD